MSSTFHYQETKSHIEIIQKIKCWKMMSFITIPIVKPKWTLFDVVPCNPCTICSKVDTSGSKSVFGKCDEFFITTQPKSHASRLSAHMIYETVDNVLSWIMIIQQTTRTTRWWRTRGTYTVRNTSREHVRGEECGKWMYRSCTKKQTHFIINCCATVNRTATTMSTMSFIINWELSAV